MLSNRALIATVLTSSVLWVGLGAAGAALAYVGAVPAPVTSLLLPQTVPASLWFGSRGDVLITAVIAGALHASVLALLLRVLLRRAAPGLITIWFAVVVTGFLAAGALALGSLIGDPSAAGLRALSAQTVQLLTPSGLWGIVWGWLPALVGTRMTRAATTRRARSAAVPPVLAAIAAIAVALLVLPTLGRQQVPPSAIGLEKEHFSEFDTLAAQLVQEERPSAIERLLNDLRDTLNPAATTERHKAASNRRYVRARPTVDGQGVLEIHSTASDIAAAYDRIRKNAVAAHGREGECRTLGALMVDEAIDAILSGRMRGPEEGGPSLPMERLGETDDPTRTLIDATILVTVRATTATGATEDPGTIAGIGSIDGETAQMIVKHTQTWTRVLIDPVDDSVFAIDSHERYIPAGLKKLLHLRQPTCGCGCGLPAHRADIDHVERFEHDGRTRHDNLQVLCRRSHQAKDADFADVRRMPDGRIAFRNKWGGVQFAKPAVTVKTASYPEEAPF